MKGEPDEEMAVEDEGEEDERAKKVGEKTGRR